MARNIAVPIVLAALFSPAALHAQREIEPTNYTQPADNDIVLRGNTLQRTVECKDNSVYVEGESNEIQIKGSCRNVRVQGNRNYVWVARNTVVNVEGVENTLFVSDPETRYSNRGTGNRYERAKHQ